MMIDRNKVDIFIAKCEERVGNEFDIPAQVAAFRVLNWIKEYLDSGALDKEVKESEDG